MQEGPNCVWGRIRNGCCRKTGTQNTVVSESQGEGLLVTERSGAFGEVGDESVATKPEGPVMLCVTRWSNEKLVGKEERKKSIELAKN